MIVAVDVQYGASGAAVSAVSFTDWADSSAAAEHVLPLSVDAPYVPGEFYRRELPCVLAVLERLGDLPATVVIDGYVWLARDRPGMGRHLFEALDGAAVIVGVAKAPFRANDAAVPVLRGNSKRALFVTAAGMEARSAADAVAAMHGRFRLPTLLKRADMLCRALAQDMTQDMVHAPARKENT